MFSATSLTTFKRCKKQFYHQYILGEKSPPSQAQADGTEFHEAIHKLSELNRNLYQEQTQKMIDALRVSEDYKKIKIEKYEQKIKAEIEGFNFLGYLDGIGKYNNKDCIVEFKSSKADYKEQDFENIRIQTGLYSLMTGIEQVIVCVVTKHKTPRVQINFNPPKASKEEIIKICEEIKKEFIYPPTAFENENTKNNCYFCSLKEKCEAWF